MAGRMAARVSAKLASTALSAVVLLGWLMSGAAAETTKVTVLDEQFQPVRTITSDQELAAFDKLWSQRTIAPSDAALKQRYKLDIVRDGRSVRWFYDPAGLTQVLTKQKTPVYTLPAAEINALLGVSPR